MRRAGGLSPWFVRAVALAALLTPGKSRGGVYEGRAVPRAAAVPPWIPYAVASAPWADPRSSHRIPLVASNRSEPSKSRSGQRLPVRVSYSLPQGLKFKTAQAIDETRDHVPCRYEQAGGQLDIRLAMQVPAGSWRPCYIYLYPSPLNAPPSAGLSAGGTTTEPGLQVLALRLQKREELPAEQVPVLNKEIVFGHNINSNWLRVDPFSEKPEEELRNIADRLIGRVKSLAGQLLIVWTDKVIWKSGLMDSAGDYLKPLLDRAHKRGVAIMIAGDPGARYLNAHPEMRNLCGANPKARDYYQGFLRDILAYPVDGILLTDESSTDGGCEFCAQKFRAKYGYVKPQAGDNRWWQEEAVLQDKRTFDLLCYKLDGETDFIGWKHRVAQQIKPGIYTAADYCPDQLPLGSFYPNGAIDFAQLGQTGTVVMTDPYFGGKGSGRRFTLRFQRGCMSNQRHAPTFIGVATWPAASIKQQALANLLYDGTSMYLWFLTDFDQHPENFEPYRDFFWQIRGTLSELLAQAKVVKFAAILYEHGSYLKYTSEDSMKYDREANDWGYLSAFQWEFLFDRGLANMKSYPLLIVPQDRHLPADHQSKILEYVEGGGVALLTGQLVEHQPFRVALGIADAKRVGDGYQLTFAEEKKGNLAAVTTSDGKAVEIVVARVGKGKLVYVPFAMAKALRNQTAWANDLLRRLIAQQLTLPAEGPSALEAVLFAGEGYYVLGVAGAKEPQEGNFRIPGVTGNWRVFDILECQEVESVTKGECSFKVKVPAGEIRYYQMVPAEKCKVKEVTGPDG